MPFSFMALIKVRKMTGQLAHMKGNAQQDWSLKIYSNFFKSLIIYNA
jgi:hypothetical protein